MGQTGASLLEVLLGVAIAIPLTLSSVLGMLLAIRTSDSVETQQRMEMALTSVAEDVKALPYVTCGTAEDYSTLYDQWSTAQAAPTDAKAGTETVQLTAAKAGATKAAAPGAVVLPPVNVASVKYWRGGAEFSDTCDIDRGAQQLVLHVRKGDRDLTATVIVRDPAAIGGTP